jgi:general secretion pathway protein M
MNALKQIVEQAGAAWRARTEQEQRFLSVGAFVVLLALAYSVLVAPAINGRVALNKSLPSLRQEAAQLQALAAEASLLGHQPPAMLVPMTKETLSASLAARSMVPASLVVTGEFAKLQFKDASFASLVTWLDAQRREGRIGVQDAAITPVGDAGLVDATLTLRQNNGEAR